MILPPTSALTLRAKTLQVFAFPGACLVRAYHIFFDTVRDATTWRADVPANVLDDDIRCDVIGLGSVQQDDGTIILITPSNTKRVRRSGRRPTIPDTCEPDANKLEAVQSVVCATGERPCFLINPNLEAMLVTPRVDEHANGANSFCDHTGGWQGDWEGQEGLMSAATDRKHGVAVAKT